MIDDGLFAEAQMQADSIIKGILDAQKIAVQEGIHANMVMINPKYAKVRGFLLSEPCTGRGYIDDKLVFENKSINYLDVPPMIAGMEAWFTDEIPEEFAFCVMNAPRGNEMQRLRQENWELRLQLEQIKEVLGVAVDD